MELLIVMAIIGLLMALLIPAVQAIMGSAKETACQNNLNQLAMIVSQYCQSWDGSFPMSGSYDNGTVNSANNWLYATPKGQTLNPPDYTTGLLVSLKLIGNPSILVCPLDDAAGMVRPKNSSALLKTGGDPGNPSGPTSYVINSSITYGDNDFSGPSPQGEGLVLKCKSRKYGQFGPRAFMFIEESSGVVAVDPPSKFDQACMSPDSGSYNLTARHNGGGYVACMDGHVEKMKTGLSTSGNGTWAQEQDSSAQLQTGSDNFLTEMNRAWSPQGGGGGSSGWWKVNGNGSGTTALGTRWNP
jgi:prepilin-type processing-associated H-X9-DG protein